MHGNRFPIFASNIIKIVNTNHGLGQNYASIDTIYYFLEKVRDANFNSVVVNLTPTNKNQDYDQYTLNFFSALERCYLNNGKDDLRVLVYDNRLQHDNLSSTLKIFQEIYSDKSILGFYIDEPYPNEFDRLSLISKLFNDSSSIFFNKLFYVNLFGLPVFDDYESYINIWIAKALPRLLSFDHYAVWDDELAKKFGDKIGFDWAKGYFVNLQIFRDFSQTYNLPFWNWILVHKHFSTYSKRYYRRASISEIKYQIYSSLAYGSNGILYYNFWNVDMKYNNNGWNEEQAILHFDGSETELFNPIKDINLKTSKIGKVLLNLKNIGVYHKTNKNIKRNKSGEIITFSEEPLFEKDPRHTQNRYGIRLIDWNDSLMLSREELANKIVLTIDNPFGLIGIFSEKSTSQPRKYYLLCVNKNRENKEKFTITLNPSIFSAGLVVKGYDQLMNIENIQSNPSISLTLEPGDSELIQIGDKNFW